MIVLDVEQGSPEWLAARIGIPTASGFGEILSPKKLQYSASAAKYRAKILAEWSQGYPVQDDMHRNGWMMRGSEMEPEALAWYAMERNVEVEPVGFVLRDDRRVGGSPDGFVGADGGVEMKVPALHTHIFYLMDSDGFVDEYRGQVQGYLYLTSRQWWDLVSYNPVLPKVLVRVERDEAYIKALHGALGRFLSELDSAKRRLLALGCNPPEWIQRPEPEQAYEAFVDQLYGPEPVADQVEAMPADILRLKQLVALAADGFLETDARLAIQYAIDKRDGQAVGAWTRKLEREVSGRKAPA